MAEVLTDRKKRAWITSGKRIPLLGRSAQYLAQGSASRMQSAAVAERLTQFVKLTAVENACKMMRGDLLVQLVDEDGLRPIDIARTTGLRQSDLSEMYKTAKAFPSASRPEGVPYNLFLMSARMVRKFPALKMPARRALTLIRRLGFSQHRDASRHFAMLARARQSQDQAGDLLNHRKRRRRKQQYCRQFQDIFDRVRNGSVKVIHVDPPYIYPDTRDGRYAGSSAASLICDNHSADAAVELVTDLLRDWQPKLAPGGVLLLWQPSAPLLLAIVDAVRHFGWALDGPIIWDKGRVQPGGFDSPYSTQTEMLWVLYRRGDELINHDGSSRSDILRFAPVSFPGLNSNQQHCFEKPQPLCEFLISKHSYPGELVLDLCGCTASMTAAAINLARNWIYVESNRQNFRLGSRRISEALTLRKSNSA